MQSSYEIVGDFTDDMKYIELSHSDSLRRILKMWLGKKLHIKISLFDDKRSLQQNKYFHAVIVQIIKDWLKETQGEDHNNEDTKLWIYSTILKHYWQEVIILGVPHYKLVGKRMSERSKKQFNEAKEAIQKYMADLDVHIPDPDPNHYSKLQ